MASDLENKTGPMSYDEQEALVAAGLEPDQMTSAECADAYRRLLQKGEGGDGGE